MGIIAKTLVLALCEILVSTQSCISFTGAAVDWFIVLKAPGKNKGFGYFDSNMENEGVTKVEVVTNRSFIDPGHAVYNTMKQINDLSLNKIAWSDQAPTGDASSSYAHSKVLVAFDWGSRKGFELDHSLPKFPHFNDDNTINLTNLDNSNTYGQHLFCISLTLDQLETLAEQTLSIKPYVYKSDIRTKLTETPYLITLNSTYISSSQIFRYNSFSVGANIVRSVFKAPNKLNISIFGDNAAGGGITEMLQANLLVETWRGDNGSYCPLPTSLTANFVSTVEYVIKVQLSPILYWNRTQDHSKWTVAKNVAWSCYGGMNRQASQWPRGGEFFCIDSANLYTAMRAIVASQELCS